MQNPRYRCFECSSDSTVVYVPSDEQAEHEAWHETVKVWHATHDAQLAEAGTE